MSETDAVTLTQSLFANALSSYSILLGLISGYLVIAYFMGKNLTRGQLAIVNFLYLGAVGFTIFAYQGFTDTAMYYSQIAAEARGGAHYYGFKYGSLVGFLFNSIMASAALVFMWIVRHQKTE